MKTPLPFQEEAIELGASTHMLLTDECGLGKTLSAVEIIKRLRATDGRGPLPSLVVCPKSVRHQWLTTIREQIPDVPVDIVPVPVPFNPDAIRNTDVIRIAHFEAVIRHWRTLKQVLWRVVVCDEAHRIRNRQADRSGAIKEIPSMRRIALTGTPIEKTPADLWSILNWLHPARYRSYHAFFDTYAVTVPTYRNYFKVVPGCKDPERLAKELSPFTLRRTKVQMGHLLPEETYVPLEMDTEQAKLYNTIDEATDVLIDIGEDDPLFVRNGLTKILRLQQVTSNPQLLNVSKLKAPSVKEEWVYDFMMDNPDESVIIFCLFRDTVRWLARRLSLPRVIGGVDGAANKITDFSTVRRMVATIDAVGEGVDLPHIDTAIFVDTSYSHTKMLQARSRIDRPLAVGKGAAPKRIIYLTVPRTVDDHVMKIYKNKGTASDLVYSLIEQRKERAQ